MANLERLIKDAGELDRMIEEALSDRHARPEVRSNQGIKNVEELEARLSEGAQLDLVHQDDEEKLSKAFAKLTSTDDQI